MKLLLMADGEVGEKTLDYLAKYFSQDVALVAALPGSAVQQRAHSARFPVITFESNAQFISAVGDLGLDTDFDLGVLAWWPKILSRQVLALSRQGFINFHPSLLPYNRGKHYNFWAIVEECPFGVTLHFVDEGVDTGDIVAQRSIGYDWCDTGETLYRKAQTEIFDLFCEWYPRIRSGDISRTAQDAGAGSFHKAAELEEASRIDLDASYTARDLINRLRARTFEGYPGCYFLEDGEKYEVRVQIKKVKP